MQPCCLNLLYSLTATDNTIKQAVMVSQGTTAWSDFRRLRITGTTCYSIYTYAKQDWKRKNNSVFFFLKKLMAML
jgi:hypothetical protein